MRRVPGPWCKSSSHRALCIHTYMHMYQIIFTKVRKIVGMSTVGWWPQPQNCKIFPDPQVGFEATLILTVIVMVQLSQSYNSFPNTVQKSMENIPTSLHLDFHTLFTECLSTVVMLVAILSQFVSSHTHTHTHTHTHIHTHTHTHTSLQGLPSVAMAMATKPMIIWHTAMSSGVGSTKGHLITPYTLYIHQLHSTDFITMLWLVSGGKDPSHSQALKLLTHAQSEEGDLFASNSIFALQFSMLQYHSPLLLMEESAPLPGLSCHSKA